MVLWRISRHRELTGAGGLKVHGRWHYAGQPVVYRAGSPSAALLEVCVHTSANDVPPEFTLLRFEGPVNPMHVDAPRSRNADVFAYPFYSRLKT
jgi:RES domain-containing protein